MKLNLTWLKKLIIGTLLSYPQVFFSKSILFAIFILIITFTFPTLGISGIIAILGSLSLASLLHLNSNSIKTGYYGYNALLVGLGIGARFQLNYELAVILIFAGFLTLLIHVALDGILNKYRLPSLSIPFVLSLWIIELALNNNSVLKISEQSIFTLNTVFSYGGSTAVHFFDYFNNQLLPNSIKYFFVALGSIFFQESAFAGFIVFIGLILFSRIAATLAVLGFFTAYSFMHFIGIDTSQMMPFFLGYNFILTTIAIAGFYLIPSLSSYLWALLLIPITVLMTFGLSKLLAPWQLAIYSLPFNIIVTSSVYILNYRTHTRKKLNDTIYQEFMPEKNLYSYKNYVKRFGNSIYKAQIMLPFWGQWTVWQGYNGKITHRDNFRHALDFVITVNGSTYKNEGHITDDYYCYNKQIVSPGYGTVVKIIDGIPDNAIGDINTINNWGNTVVIKHADNFYSQLNHIKAGSFKVKEGDYVVTGQPLANVGNSGRSPQPHLHFQLQAFPFVGSFTVEYPISRYLKISQSEKNLQSFSIPQENDIIENITVNNLFSQALHFIPGQIIEIVETKNNKVKYYQWEVLTDSLNNTYIYCKTSNSAAYIYNDGLSHYFKSFIGKKKSPLFQFYKTCYHIELINAPNFCVKDQFPLHHIYPFSVLFIHDIFAPFFRFIKADFSLCETQKGSMSNSELNSTISNIFLGKTIKSTNASISISKQGINKITIYEKKYTNLQFNYKQRFV